MKEQFPELVNIYHETGLWLPDRKIYLQLEVIEDGEPEITAHTAENAIKNIHILESAARKPITMIINCGGGSEIDGYAIYDVVLNSDCYMVGIVAGQAMSMATILLQAFDHRMAYRSSTFMLHDGSDSISGNVRDVERAAEQTRLARLKAYGILEERTNHDRQYWARKLASDFYLTAEQALEHGLIDEIIG